MKGGGRMYNNGKEKGQALNSKNNEFFQAMIATLPDVLVFLNNKGEFLQIWTGREENLYLPRKQLLGKKVLEILPKKVGRKVYDSVIETLDKQIQRTIEFELNVIGGKKYFEARISPVEKNKVIMSVRDITARKQAKNKIEELHRVALKLAECEKREDIYAYTVEAAENVLEFDVCTLDIVEDEKFVVKATSSGKLADKSEPSSIYEGLAGRCYREETSLIIDDIYEHKEAEPVDDSFRSALSVPIGEFGIFQVISTNIADFDEEDLKLTELLISHTYTALKRIEAKEEIEYLGFHDELTGLYNRKYINAELDRLDTQRQMPISIIMGDVNGLKLVNDAFGHKEGDKILKEIAGVLKKSCREEDIIGRFGGDEFIIVLPKTDHEEAEQITERIKNNCHRISNDEIFLSIAMGVATKSKIEEDMDEILKMADDSMYDRKLVESEKTRQYILEKMIERLGDRKKEIKEHSLRVQELAVKLGRNLDLSSAKLGKLSQAAFLHDIGLVAISEELIDKLQKLAEASYFDENKGLNLSKAGINSLTLSSLTQKEWEEIKKHPAVGYRIVRSSERFAHLAEAILYHHERWNGTGYPSKLKGREIPFLARVIHLVDAYDVLSEGIIDNEKLSKEQIINIIRSSAGKFFDPELVKVFLNII